MDPNSDSWLSKNVRPIIIIMVLATISIVIIIDKDIRLMLIKSYVGWAGVIITYYFGVRDIIKSIGRKKNK